jgi:hypothetical protein
MLGRGLVSFCVALFLIPSLSFASISADHQEEWKEQSFSDVEPPEPTAGVTDYHTYDEMVTELNQIAMDHSDIVQLTSIGKTFENRDIWTVKISDNPMLDEDEPEVVFYGMHHAREWLTAEVPLYIINFLTDNYQTNATVQYLVDERETWIIPIVNPDGRTYDGEDDPTTYWNWRKNRVINSDGSRGVDLNRNYGHMWGGAGASDDPQNDVFRGEYPFSENETKAIRDLALQHDFVFSLSYHSSGQIILYPWGYTVNPSPDDLLLSSIAQGMADRMTNKAQSPREKYIPIRGGQLYLTSGDDVDWMHGELGVLPFVVELYPSFSDSSPAVTSPYNGFHPREDKIQPVCEDNLGGALYLLEIADNPFQAISHVSLTAIPQKQTIDRGQNRSFQIEVFNDGNQSDTFDLVGLGPPGWEISFSQSTMSLTEGKKVTVGMWVNVPGFSPAGDFVLEVSASSPSTTGFVDVEVFVPYGNDVGVSNILPFAEGEEYPMGNYTVQAEVANHGGNQQNAFDVMMEVFEIGPLEDRTLLSQGFEGGMSGWTVIDYDGSRSLDEWHIVNGVANSGFNSIWVGDDLSGTYSDETLQVLLSPPFSLREARGANLSFYQVLSTEISYDYAVVEVGVGDEWTILVSWSGFVSFSFTRFEFDLSDYLGEDEVRVRFRFSSDEHVTEFGWYLDDIRVDATFPREDLIHGPVLSQTTTVLEQGEKENVSWKYKFKKGGQFKVVARSLLVTDEYQYNDSAEVSFFIDPSRYRIFLNKGLNLVSYPLIVNDESSDAVLSDIQGSYDSIWMYVTYRGWEMWSASKSWNGPIVLNFTKGWWIRVTEDTYFDVHGSVPGDVPISLGKGWNLLGYPSLTDRRVADALAFIKYTRIEAFDELSPYHLKALSGDDYMTSGMGYWIYVIENTVLSVNP